MLKPKIVSRRIEGFQLFPTCVRLIYYDAWSDGRLTYEKGRTVYGTPSVKRSKSKLTERLYRPDLGALMQAAMPLIEVLENACLWADEYKPRKKRRKRPKPGTPPRRKPVRVVEL